MIKYVNVHLPVLRQTFKGSEPDSNIEPALVVCGLIRQVHYTKASPWLLETVNCNRHESIVQDLRRCVGALKWVQCGRLIFSGLVSTLYPPLRPFIYFACQPL